MAPDAETPVSAPADTTAVENAQGASAVAAAFSSESAPEPVVEEKAAEPAPAVAPAPKAKAKKEKAKPAAKPKPKTTTHTVRRGENLSKIAKKYGVTVQALKKANNFAGDQIQVGQKIKIPAK